MVCTSLDIITEALHDSVEFIHLFYILSVLAVGMVAVWIPARHALAVDPMILLRQEKCGPEMTTIITHLYRRILRMPFIPLLR